MTTTPDTEPGAAALDAIEEATGKKLTKRQREALLAAAGDLASELGLIPAPQPEPAVGDTAMLDFEWNDRTWSVPASADDWSFDAARAMEDGKALRFVELILGPRQMVQFRTGGRTTAADGAALMNEILAAVGARSAGESSASSA